MNDALQDNPADLTEYLSFRIGAQEYTVDIMSVREIRGWTEATPLPHAPSYVRGVINLRGTVLPIIDLAARLGLPPDTDNDRSVVIVVQHNSETVGLLVDAVSDILTIARADLQTPPDMAADNQHRFVSALIIENERMIRVLDLNNTLTTTENQAA
ncbi:chemotaxis protein CheW [Halocynthiibacter styelae]|uniref:Chemotaxis protein CheW n=1 Tax=Halocynthiibacter styelae TaxID=2761955 RepID=A0A8J7IC35_9RHOB|nr:chemotaxis protein CheW [Paenihalocynthiibacter styelae]MBI1492254.1 chemotaxis protein CheW [Paenihalocynthiibacter styelae]